MVHSATTHGGRALPRRLLNQTNPTIRCIRDEQVAGPIHRHTTVDVHDALMGQRHNQFRESRPHDWVENDTRTVAVRDADYFGNHILLFSCNDVCGTRFE
jgi:hypothetical protein